MYIELNSGNDLSLSSNAIEIAKTIIESPCIVYSSPTLEIIACRWAKMIESYQPYICYLSNSELEEIKAETLTDYSSLIIMSETGQEDIKFFQEVQHKGLKRFCITYEPLSPLAKAADYVLVFPDDSSSWKTQDPLTRSINITLYFEVLTLFIEKYSQLKLLKAIPI